jgi:hypothetical protein
MGIRVSTAAADVVAFTDVAPIPARCEVDHDIPGSGHSVAGIPDRS